MWNPRVAQPEDASSIAKVHVDAWRTTYRGIVADEFLATLNYEDRTVRWAEIVARSDGDTFVVEAADAGIIGFSNCGPERSGDFDYTGELYSIYLLDSFRGRGIGSVLFRAAAAALLESGHTDLMVWVLQDNPYRGFYEDWGGKHFHTDEVNIGGQSLTEFAYGWRDIEAIARD